LASRGQFVRVFPPIAPASAALFFVRFYLRRLLNELLPLSVADDRAFIETATEIRFAHFWNNLSAPVYFSFAFRN
jgi:hypothetical protein